MLEYIYYINIYTYTQREKEKEEAIGYPISRDQDNYIAGVYYKAFTLL